MLWQKYESARQILCILTSLTLILEMDGRKITTEDGFQLHLTSFGGGDKRATIIFNCATAVPQQFYYRYAHYLSTHGYHCICWDYRGIGKSAGETIQDNDFSLNDWGNQDMSAVLRYAKDEYPDCKIIVFAHSIGGAILGFCKDHSLIDGLLFHAVQTAYYKDWRFPHNIRLILEWHIGLPLITKVYDYFPGMKFGLGTDISKKYVEHWSHRFKHPDIKKLFSQMDDDIHFDDFRCSFFCFNMTDDYIATPKAIDRMNAAFSNLEGESIWINPRDYGVQKVGHFDFFKQKYKETFWKMSLEWIEKVS